MYFAVVYINICADFHKSLASVCCHTDSCGSRHHFALLLEDIEGAKKVGVDLSEPRVLSHLRDPGRTGDDTDKGKPKKFRGWVPKVCTTAELGKMTMPIFWTITLCLCFYESRVNAVTAIESSKLMHVPLK